VPGQYAFTHANRLHKRAEYDQIFQRGAKVVGRHFVCYWVRRGESGSKLGVAVSRKVGKAVVRNRVKRYLREYFRTHRQTFASDVALVVVARRSCADLTFQESADALDLMLRQGGVVA
jgi:ribonuclease P protein component